jgi:hypothetical protein
LIPIGGIAEFVSLHPQPSLQPKLAGRLPVSNAWDALSLEVFIIAK